MKRKCYRSMKEVKEDLKILKLRRDINLVELHTSKLEMEDRIRPLKTLVYIAGTLKKYGAFFLIRKLLK